MSILLLGAGEVLMVLLFLFDCDVVGYTSSTCDFGTLPNPKNL
jgi:hypothetical protein